VGPGDSCNVQPPAAGVSDDLTLEHPDIGAIKRTEDILRRSADQGSQPHGTGKLWLYHDRVLIEEEKVKGVRVSVATVLYQPLVASTDHLRLLGYPI
jgi:hypothetical protein